MELNHGFNGWENYSTWAVWAALSNDKVLCAKACMFARAEKLLSLQNLARTALFEEQEMDWGSVDWPALMGAFSPDYRQELFNGE